VLLLATEDRLKLLQQLIETEQGILSAPGIAGYKSVPARTGCFLKIQFFFIIPMAN